MITRTFGRQVFSKGILTLCNLSVFLLLAVVVPLLLAPDSHLIIIFLEQLKQER